MDFFNSENLLSAPAFVNIELPLTPMTLIEESSFDSKNTSTSPNDEAREIAIAETRQENEATSPDTTFKSPSRDVTTAPASTVSAVPRSNAAKRTVFTKTQLKTLEDRFRVQSFLSREERAELAKELSLTERQVIIWFQNRRGRLKKRGPMDKAYSAQKLNELNRPYPILYGMLATGSDTRRSLSQHNLWTIYPDNVRRIAQDAMAGNGSPNDNPVFQPDCVSEVNVKAETNEKSGDAPPNVVVCSTSGQPIVRNSLKMKTADIRSHQEHPSRRHRLYPESGNRVIHNLNQNQEELLGQGQEYSVLHSSYQQQTYHHHQRQHQQQHNEQHQHHQQHQPLYFRPDQLQRNLHPVNQLHNREHPKNDEIGRNNLNWAAPLPPLAIKTYNPSYITAIPKTHTGHLQSNTQTNTHNGSLLAISPNYYRRDTSPGTSGNNNDILYNRPKTNSPPTSQTLLHHNTDTVNNWDRGMTTTSNYGEFLNHSITSGSSVGQTSFPDNKRAMPANQSLVHHQYPLHC